MAAVTDFPKPKLKPPHPAKTSRTLTSKPKGIFIDPPF